jgi:O-antigen ligase
MNSTLTNSKRPHAPMGGFLSLLIGLSAFSSTPELGSADFLRMQVGSYAITYFDLVVLLSALVLCSTLSLRIHAHDKKVVRALFFVTITRIVSLLAASALALEQLASVLRYAETLTLIVVLANLLQGRRNRVYFIVGVILGTAIETAGGIWILLTSAGEARGVWLGTDNYKWQVYLLFACMLFLASRKHILVCAFSAAALSIGILSTETRAALVLLLLIVIVCLATYRRQLVKPMLVSIVLVCIVIAPVIEVLPEAASVMKERIEQLWSGGGVIGYRLILIEMAAAAFVNHPLTGIGSGGFARQQNELYLNINDAFAPGYVTAYGSLSTHNTVLGVAAETGILGLVAYFTWLYAISRICFDTLKLRAASYDTFLIAACVLTIAFMFQDFWSQASFLASSSCIIGFVMGWRREHDSEEYSEIQLPNSQVAAV